MAKINDEELFLTTTDTVIGLGGKVNPVVAQKIYALKQRPLDKRLVIVVANLEQLKQLEKLEAKHYFYIEKYWPGPTTLIINNQAYRIPNQPELCQLIAKEGPFYLTSANLSKCSTIINIQKAKQVFPNLKAFDFGPGSNQASTIIDTETGKKLR